MVAVEADTHLPGRRRRRAAADGRRYPSGPPRPAATCSPAGYGCWSPRPSPTTSSRRSSRITAGTIASSTALIGFGLDSVIEVSSAAAVAWQFSARDHAVREAREKTTLRIIAVSFFALAAYVTVDAVRALTGTGEADALDPRHRARRPLAGGHAVPVRRPAPRRPRTRLRLSASPTPSRPCCAPTCPPCSWSAWSSTPPSAGPGPTRSPPWSSPPSPSRKAATPGRARAAARPRPPQRSPSAGAADGRVRLPARLRLLRLTAGRRARTRAARPAQWDTGAVPRLRRSVRTLSALWNSGAKNPASTCYGFRAHGGRRVGGSAAGARGVPETASAALLRCRCGGQRTPVDRPPG